MKSEFWVNSSTKHRQQWLLIPVARSYVSNACDWPRRRSALKNILILSGLWKRPAAQLPVLWGITLLVKRRGDITESKGSLLLQTAKLYFPWGPKRTKLLWRQFSLTLGFSIHTTVRLPGDRQYRCYKGQGITRVGWKSAMPAYSL